jgi:REP element-mobilizing transposase RayT
MARPLRRYRPGTTWHVTSRTIEERFLLALEPAVVSAIGACLARAAATYFVHVNAFVQMNNHLHLEVTLTRPNLHHFMRTFLSAVAKVINAHLGRQGKVFGERYSATEILDHDAQVEKLAYINANPCNANLVDRAADWPGLTSARALVTGEPLVFQKVNRTAFDRARRRDPEARPEDFLETHELRLTPLPGWQHLPPEEQRRLAAEAITAAEDAARAKRQAEGKTVMPRHRLLGTKPTDRPRRPKRGKRPLCHTTISELFQAYREEWWLFRQDYGAASEKYRAGSYATRFPDSSIRPPLLDVS